MDALADSQPRTVAERIVEQLEAWRVQVIFGIIGDSIAPLVEAVSKSRSIRYIGVRNEEAAALAASAYAKITGNLAVCLADAGPGAVRLLNGVYDARYDSVPLLALTGQSPQEMLFTSYYQTTDQNRLFAAAADFSATVTDPKQALKLVRQAIHRAYAQQTAVHIALPKDVLQKPLAEQPKALPQGTEPPYRLQPIPNAQVLDRMASELNRAQRPLILFGRSAWSYKHELHQLAELLGAPMIHTLPAAGVLAHDDEHSIGILGDAGNPVSRKALAEADVILVIGSSWWPQGYNETQAILLQIELSPARSFTGELSPDLLLFADAKQAVESLLPRIDARRKKAHESWLRRLNDEYREWRNGRRDNETSEPDRLHPRQVMAALSAAIPADALITLDVGEHTLWFGAAFEARGQDILVSGMWRSMGFALPAALAGRAASAERPIYAIVGDGGFVMSMAEILTALQHQLPVAVIVMNNHALAQEIQAQKAMGLQPVAADLQNPSFAELARSMGAEGMTIQEPDQLVKLLPKLGTPGKITIVDIPVSISAAPEMARKIADQDRFKEHAPVLVSPM